MEWSEIDWKALERLRAAFLDGSAGAADYWQSESDLASYDTTFAQRIGWKWDYVLGELARRGWVAPPGDVLDWGCGSGVAGRAFLDHFGTNGVTALWLWDRSTPAMQFAARRAREKYPGLVVNTGLGAPPATLLISHVLGELTIEQTRALAEFAAAATAVLWVEPGTYEASLTLIAVRERLRDRLHVVAPCTHAARCGLLTPGNERHWCHHFATPPPEVFTDGRWARFANLVGIDLWSLPLSFLVMDRRPAPALPVGAARVLGRPRVYKALARLLGCDPTGVAESTLTQKRLPGAFKQLKRGGYDPLQVWQREGKEIVASRPL